jgi:hypothetical protein
MKAQKPIFNIWDTVMYTRWPSRFYWRTFVVEERHWDVYSFKWISSKLFNTETQYLKLVPPWDKSKEQYVSRYALMKNMFSMKVWQTMLYVWVDYQYEIKRIDPEQNKPKKKPFSYVIIDEYAKNTKTSPKKKDDLS